MEDVTEITIAVPDWIAESYKISSLELRGTIGQSTQRAFEFTGIINVRRSDRCLSCKTNLDYTDKQHGYCPACQLRIRDESVNGKLKVYTFWVPRDQVTIIDGSSTQLPDHEPDPAIDVMITIRINESYIEAQANKFSTGSKNALKGVKGSRWVPGLRLWRYPASPAVARELEQATSRYTTNVTEGFRDLLAQESVREGVAKFRDMKMEDLPTIPKTNTDLPPWEHQLQAYHFAKDLKSAALFMSMGTGKSRCTLDLLQTSKETNKVLIMCPKSVIGVWPREFKRWGVDKGRWLVCPLSSKSGSIAKRAEKAQAFIEKGEQYDLSTVIIINYEAVWRSEFGEWALKQKWDFIVADEVHKIKSHNSRVGKYAGRLGRRAKRKLALTGTPMPNNPLDLYGQYLFLDPGIYGTSFVSFRARYASMGGFEGKQVTSMKISPTLKTGGPNPTYDPRLEAEFRSKMFSIAIEIGDEVLDLPELSIDFRDFELSPKARRAYDKMENEKYVDLVQEGVIDDIVSVLEKVKAGDASDEEIELAAKYLEAGNTESSAANVMVKMLRLQQMTSGVIRDDDGFDHVVDRGKKELLEDLIEPTDPSHGVVVFCRFRHDLEVVKEVADKLGRRYGELSGSRRDAITEDSEMAPGIEVAGVQIQSGGVGIDLTRARYVAYYSLTHSLGEFEQSMKRVHRPGQNHPVNVYHLTAKDTVDEDIYAAIKGKGRIVDHVLRGLKKRNE